MNPFNTTYNLDSADQELIQQTLDGKKAALTTLVKRH
jgi:hypothetical protein